MRPENGTIGCCPVVALVPIKGFDRAKSRLGLPDGQRVALAESLARHTLCVLRDAGIPQTFVVSDNAEVLLLAANHGCQVVSESRPEAGLNAALRDATLAAYDMAPEAGTLAIVADLPMLDRSTVGRAVRLFSTAKAPMFVSDWHGTGSTVVFRPSGDTQDTHFGPSSAHHHRAAGYTSCLEDEHRLRKDLDDPSDLEKAAPLLPAFRRVDCG